jgi:Cu2+-exporting ATPase
LTKPGLLPRANRQSRIEWRTNDDKSAGINILYSLENLSEHPLAESVANYLKKSATPLAMTDVTSITGRGISGAYGHKKYLAGGLKLMVENRINIDPKLEGFANNWEKEANTVIFFADSSDVLAVLSVSDKIKESSRVAIRQLKNLGIDVYLVTGDNQKTAGAVAEKTGISGFKAEMLPSDKAAFITSLQKEGKTVNGRRRYK